MEQSPTNNEQDGPAQFKPILAFDAVGETGNVFSIISRTIGLLEGEEREQFQAEIAQATAPGAGKQYDDILAIVDSHVELLDASGTHPVYGNTERVDAITQRHQQYITAAVDKLNAQILTLPDSMPVHIDGVYPEFDDPAYSPLRYVAMLYDEMARVNRELAQSDEAQREAWRQYEAMLSECERTLRRAGLA
jgi:hypothetical protein